MEVEHAVGRQVEQGGRYDLAVVGQHTEVGPQGGDLGDRVGRTKPRRLEERQAVLVGKGRDRNGVQGSGSAGRTVGRADHSNNLDRRVGQQSLEDRDGERTAAQEDDPGALVRRGRVWPREWRCP